MDKQWYVVVKEGVLQNIKLKTTRNMLCDLPKNNQPSRWQVVPKSFESYLCLTTHIENLLSNDCTILPVEFDPKTALHINPHHVQVRRFKLLPPRTEIIKTVFATIFVHEGKLHNLAGPAVLIGSPTTSNNSEFWYQDGKLHRDGDLPAVVNDRGLYEWYQNGELHRDNDLPATFHVSHKNLTARYFQHGVEQRI